MTPRSFWKVLLKLYGLIVFLDAFPVLMERITFVFQVLSNDGSQVIAATVYGIIAIAVVVGISYLLIFQPDTIINKLRLHEGFEEDIFTINMHRSTILTIAVIVLGGWIFIDTLPHLIEQVAPFFQRKAWPYESNDPNHAWLIYYSAKLFVSLLMLIYSRHIVNFIEAKRKRSGSKLMIDPSDKEEA